jgi:predicted O-linked N-acetylglucosamine transferase (SPINDLY family)
MEARGLSPSERLFFVDPLPKQQHLQRLATLVDIVLDTPARNGHTFCVDALWACLPVITCPWSSELASMPSRAASSILKNGTRGALEPEIIQWLAVCDLQEYEEAAIWLAQSPEELLRIRQRLRNHRTKMELFDARRWVQSLAQLIKSLCSNP